MKLFRSNDDYELTGVCGGLAKNLGWDSWRLRVVWVITTFFTGGAGIFVYLALWYLMPKEPPAPQNFEPAVLQPWKKTV